MHLSSARLITVLCAALATPVALSAPSGPVYPPPGGVTFSTSNTDAGRASGRTLFYSGMQPAQYSELDWTFTSVANPYHQGFQGGFTGNMAFSGYNPSSGISSWVSTANITWLSAQSQPISFQVTLQVQFQPFVGTPLGPMVSGWLVPTTVGALGIIGLPAAQSVLDVDARPNPDSFQVWHRYVATSTGQALLDLYDNNNNGPSLIFTSASGGFYWAPPVPVPEPAAAWLWLLGLSALTTRCVRALRR